jgi:hypothetical protein
VPSFRTIKVMPNERHKQLTKAEKHQLTLSGIGRPLSGSAVAHIVTVFGAITADSASFTPRPQPGAMHLDGQKLIGAPGYVDTVLEVGGVSQADVAIQSMLGSLYRRRILDPGSASECLPIKLSDLAVKGSKLVSFVAEAGPSPHGPVVEQLVKEKVAIQAEVTGFVPALSAGEAPAVPHKVVLGDVKGVDTVTQDDLREIENSLLDEVALDAVGVIKV